MSVNWTTGLLMFLTSAATGCSQSAGPGDFAVASAVGSSIAAKSRVTAELVTNEIKSASM